MRLHLLRRTAALLAAVACLGWVTAAIAAGEGPERRVEVAPVVIDGARLFMVRGTTSYTAPERAAAIAGRIEAVAEDPAFDPAELRLVPDMGGVAIVAGSVRIAVFFQADADVEQVPVALLAEANVQRIRAAINEYRAARTPERLRASAVQAVVVTLLFVGAVALLFWSTSRLRQRVERDVHARIHAVGIQSFEIVRAERLRIVISASLRAGSVVLLFVLLFFWLVHGLGQFPWTSGLAATLLDYVMTPLKVLAAGVLAVIPDLIFLAILYYVARAVLRILRTFFVAVEHGRVTLSGFEPEWAMPTYKIVRIGVIGLALVVAYPYIPGSESAAFKGLSLFAGVVFSLGSSSAISNMVAGFMLTYRRAFRVGDFVRIGEVTGIVTEMRLQVTHLRTTKNEEVVVPNSQILSGHVTNYSTLAKSSGLLLHTTVGIGYETPWRQVEAMLLEAAGRTPGLGAAPESFVLQTALGDFAVTYELNVPCDDPQRMPQLYSALHRNILDVFNEYGVAIMTPAYVADPVDAKLVPKKDWYLPPAKPDAA